MAHVLAEKQEVTQTFFWSIFAVSHLGFHWNTLAAMFEYLMSFWNIEEGYIWYTVSAKQKNRLYIKWFVISGRRPQVLQLNCLWHEKNYKCIHAGYCTYTACLEQKMCCLWPAILLVSNITWVYLQRIIYLFCTCVCVSLGWFTVASFYTNSCLVVNYK